MTTAKFGYETLGGSVFGLGNYMWGSAYLCVNGGTAESISVGMKYDVYARTPKVKCAIYLESDKSLVGSTEERTITLTATAAWYIFNFTGTKPTLTANTTYILVAWCDDASAYSKIVYTSGAGATTYYKAVTYGDWPATWSGYDSFAARTSIYCTYTVAGGTTYELNLNAVCQSSATPAEESTFNVAKDAAVSSQNLHARETTFNLPKDAISRALSNLAFELSFSSEATTKATAIPSEELTFNIAKNAQVTVQALSTHETLFNITKTAISQALAQLNLETTFNINKDALVNASATIIIEAFIEILKDAVVQARALHSQETSFNVFTDAKTEALASLTSETTYNLVKDAISTALADLQTETIIASALHKWGFVLPFRLLQKYLATGRAVYLEKVKKEITGKSIHPKRLNLEAHGTAVKPVRTNLTIEFQTVHKALNLQGYGKAVRLIQAKGNLQGRKIEQVTKQLPVTGKQRLDLVLELLGIELTLTYIFVAVVDDKTCEHCMQHDTKQFTREQIDMQFPDCDDTDYTLILPNAHPHCRCLLILLEIGF